jgi:hypothetical protein
MANKYPKPVEVKSIQFQWYWKGNRTPKFVIFPNGRKTEVVYMREGKIAFDCGENGTYKRLLDNNITNERRIEIEIEE